MPKHGEHVAGHRDLQYWGPNLFIRVRIKVNREIRPYLAAPHTGKSELIKALGTQSIPEAVKRSHGVIHEFQNAINHAWREFGRPRPEFVMNLSTVPKAADLLAAIWLVRQMAPADHQPVLYVGDLSKRTPPGEPTLAGITWEAGLEKWVESHGSEPPADTTQAVYRGHLRRFMAWVGTDDLTEVREQHILDYPHVLVTGADGGRHIENKSVNNHLASIRAVLRAAAKKYKFADPTVGNIHKLPEGESRRGEFSEDQHSRIMLAALAATDPCTRYLWLLGGTLGARIGELADATISAVYQRDGFWVFDINEKHRRVWGGKPIPLKTRGKKGSSKRIVPLSALVLGSGFLDYVAERRAAAGERGDLFPKFEPNEYGRYSDAASIVCNEWLRNVVKIDEGPGVLTFHGYRHFCKTYLRGAVGDELQRKITGHAGQTVSEGYGSALLARMKAAIEDHIPLANGKFLAAEPEPVAA